MPAAPATICKTDSRLRLLGAARELLWCNSYATVSVDDLCKAADVNKGSFYHHFESKVALAQAAFESMWDDMRPFLDTCFSPLVPPLERFDRYAAGVLELQSEKQRQYGMVLGCPYTALGVEARPDESVLRELAQMKGERTRLYFASAIRDAMAQGLIPVGDPESLAHDCSALISGVACQARIANALDPFTRLSSALRRVLGAR